jgi:alkylation response protein AidB-like acyl-CoA dehydrogenase
VKVPKDQIVGEVNKGWDVAKYLLGHEREMISGMGLGGSSRRRWRRAWARSTIRCWRRGRPVRRRRLAFAAMSEHFIDQLKAGEAHPAMPSMMKYAGTELNKKRHELIMAAGGSDALEWDSERSRGGKAAREWLRTKANSIEGGPAKSSSASSPSTSCGCRGLACSALVPSEVEGRMQGGVSTSLDTNGPEEMILTDDQRQLADMTRTFLGEEGTIKKQLRHWRDTGCKDGFGHGLWKQMAELGLTGLASRKRRAASASARPKRRW